MKSLEFQEFMNKKWTDHMCLLGKLLSFLKNIILLIKKTNLHGICKSKPGLWSVLSCLVLHFICT